MANSWTVGLRVFMSVLVVLMLLGLPAAISPVSAQTDDSDTDDEERRPVTITPSNLLQPADRT